MSRIVDIAATTGHGTPLQTMFKMADGERIVGAMGFDPRFLDVPPVDEESEEPEEPYAIAVTRGGLALRFSLRAHREPSTRSGRKFTRPKQGDEVILRRARLRGGLRGLRDAATPGPDLRSR